MRRGGGSTCSWLMRVGVGRGRRGFAGDLTEGEIGKAVTPLVSGRRGGTDASSAKRMQGHMRRAEVPHAIPALGDELEFSMRADLMFCSDDGFGEVTSPRRYLHGLVDGGDDADNVNAFSKGNKFTESREGVASSPSAMGKDESIHEFIGPCVLDLKGLLVLERLRCKTTY